MAVVSDDALDTPLTFENQRSFTGSDSWSQARLLADGVCSDLLNVDLDRAGIARTREGLISLPAIEGTSTVRGLTSYRNVSVGPHTLAFKNGNLYRFTSYSAGWSVIGSSVVNQDEPVFTAPVADRLYFVDTTTAGQLKYWEGTSVVTVPTTGAVSAPAGMTNLISSNGRLFAVRQSEPDTLLVGDFLTANFNLASNSIRVGGDGNPITAIREWTGDRIAVFKENSVFVVSNISQSSASNFEIEAVASSNGSISQKATLRVGADIFFASRDGVRSLTRTLQGAEQAISLPLSRPVQDLYDLMDKNTPEEIHACFYENTVVFTGPTLGDPDRTHVSIAYDTVRNSFLGEWSGNFYPYCSGLVVDGMTLPSFLSMVLPFKLGGVTNTKAGLAIGDRSGRVYIWRKGHNFGSGPDATYRDDVVTPGAGGKDIPTRVSTRGFTFGEVDNFKIGNSVECQFYESLADADLYVKLDDYDFEFLKSIGTGPTPLTLPFSLPQQLGGYESRVIVSSTDLMSMRQFREIIVRVQASSKLLSVRGFMVSAYIQPYIPA